MSKLLSINADAKTIKGNKKGYDTGPGPDEAAGGAPA